MRKILHEYKRNKSCIKMHKHNKNNSILQPTCMRLKLIHSFLRASLIKFFGISVLIRTMYKGYCVALFEFKFLPISLKLQLYIYIIRYAYTYIHISYKQYYIHAKHFCIKSLRHKLMTLYFITKDVISSRHIQQMSNIPTLPNMNRKWNTLSVM